MYFGCTLNLSETGPNGETEYGERERKEWGIETDRHCIVPIQLDQTRKEDLVRKGNRVCKLSAWITVD